MNWKPKMCLRYVESFDGVNLRGWVDPIANIWEGSAVKASGTRSVYMEVCCPWVSTIPCGAIAGGIKGANMSPFVWGYRDNMSPLHGNATNNDF